MKKESAQVLIYYLSTVLLGLLASVLFSGCTTATKATRFMVNNPSVGAAYCAANWPAKDSIVTHTDTVIKSVNVDHTEAIDSLNQAITEAENTDDSGSIVRWRITKLKSHVSALKASYKPCKPDTLVRKVTIYQRDRAYERVQADSISALQDRNMVLGNDLQRAKKFKLWFWILVGAMGAFTFLKIKRILPF